MSFLLHGPSVTVRTFRRRQRHTMTRAGNFAWWLGPLDQTKIRKASTVFKDDTTKAHQRKPTHLIVSHQKKREKRRIHKVRPMNTARPLPKVKTGNNTETWKQEMNQRKDYISISLVRTPCTQPFYSHIPCHTVICLQDISTPCLALPPTPWSTHPHFQTIHPSQKSREQSASNVLSRNREETSPMCPNIHSLRKKTKCVGRRMQADAKVK